MADQDDKGTTSTGTLVTDLAADKTPGTPPTPDTTAPAAEPAKPAGNTTAPELPSWTTSTSKNLRSDPRFGTWASKYKTLDEAVTSSIEQEEKVGKLVAIPDEKSSDEEKAGFYSKLGVPAKAEDYKIDMGEDSTVDPKAVEEFKKLAHAHHMTNESANSFFKLAEERMENEIAAYRARTNEEKAATANALKNEWKADYDKNVAQAIRGLRAFGAEDLIKDAEATGMGNKLSFMKLLHKIGGLSLEDSATHKPGGSAPARSAASVLYPEKT